MTDWRETLREEWGVNTVGLDELDGAEGSEAVERFRAAVKELADAWQALPTAIQHSIGDVELTLEAEPEEGAFDEL